MSQGFRRKGFGGLPPDLVRGGSALVPSHDVPGYDATGTRYTMPGGGRPLPIPIDSPWYELIRLGFRAVRRQSQFLTTFVVASNAAAIQVRPLEERTYLLLQNRSTSTIYIGLGYSPTSVNGIELTSGAVYEPFQVPNNEIFALGSIAGAQNLIVLYAMD